MQFSLISKQLFSLLLTFLLFTACSKTENYIAEDLKDEWNLVYSDGHRALPNYYDRGDIVWSFENKKINVRNNIENYSVVYDYTIIDTLDETHLRIDGNYYGTIILHTKDSLILSSAKYIGCGDGYLFIR